MTYYGDYGGKGCENVVTKLLSNDFGGGKGKVKTKEHDKEEAQKNKKDTQLHNRGIIVQPHAQGVSCDILGLVGTAA